MYICVCFLYVQALVCQGAKGMGRGKAQSMGSSEAKSTGRGQAGICEAVCAPSLMLSKPMRQPRWAKWAGGGLTCLPMALVPMRSGGGTPWYTSGAAPSSRRPLVVISYRFLLSHLLFPVLSWS